MKVIFIKFLLLFYLLSPDSLYAIDHPNIKNLILHKEPKKLENFEFKNVEKQDLKLSDFTNKLLLINFWATWCAPCRDEMPSLDKIHNSKKFKNLEIIPINVGSEDIIKSIRFYEEIKIKNLKIYYDDTLDLPKKFLLRGIPTTILINKSGEEFARILGTIDFQDINFINWLKKYD